jgi:hypothetical protein
MSFYERMILEINITHHYKFMCPLYSHVEAFNIINMNDPSQISSSNYSTFVITLHYLY